MPLPLDKRVFCGRIANADAGIAHPVERHLAKVEVASSSLVARSISAHCSRNGRFSFICGYEIGHFANALQLKVENGKLKVEERGWYLKRRLLLRYGS